MQPGTSVAHYTIVERIGAGGMGEVFKAQDTRLRRDVAVKALPPAFCADPERVARFEREARSLAALQHPNVASIYGLETVGERTFLVMELVEGEDLSERLQRGPLTVERALEIGGQIATGLEAAHEKGIVHRDLKPANVKLGSDGSVKILDFGLARAMADDADQDDDLSASPTLTAAMTGAGVILGTAAYMSPEQARGRSVDRRADLWALGVILFEMLTGRQLFAGETVSDTLAGILRADIPWDELPRDLPAGLRRVLTRCLERDARRRLQAAGDARVELSDAADEAPEPAGAAPVQRRSGVSWLVAAPLLAVMVTAALYAGRALAPQASSALPPGSLLDLTLCTEGRLYTDAGPAALLTPDGQTIVFLEEIGAKRRLMVRRLTEPQASPLPGTNDAILPFLSPDGEWVGFFANNRLRKVWLGGGSPLDICTADGGRSRGATWGPDDIIAFTPSTGSGLYVVPAAGGEPRPLTELDKSRSERSHRWPAFSPDGRYVLFNTQFHNQNYHDGNVEAVEVATGERHVVHRGGAFPRPVDGRHVIFVRENTAYALEVDKQLRPRSEPRPVLSNLAASTGDETASDGSALLHVSRSGGILYRHGAAVTVSGKLAVVDLDGDVTELNAPTASYFYPRVSPDGRTVAVTTVQHGMNEVWLYDLVDGSSSRLHASDGVATLGFWDADGRHIFFAQGGWSARGVDRISLDDRGSTEEVLRADADLYPHEMSRDGRWMLVNRHSEATSWDIMRCDRLAHPDLPLTIDQFEAFVASTAQDGSSRVSPDGRWMAYDSLESGTFQIYLCDMADPSRRWLVSSDGGEDPTWSDDSRRVFYVDGRTIMAVDLNPGRDGLRPGTPTALFTSTQSRLPNIWTYDKIHGRDAFVMILEDEDSRQPWPGEVVMMLDWRASWDLGD
jgi:Tol biopolymer transport system component